MSLGGQPTSSGKNSKRCGEGVGGERRKVLFLGDYHHGTDVIRYICILQYGGECLHEDVLLSLLIHS